jgi:FkbM family methyltransferase
MDNYFLNEGKKSLLKKRLLRIAYFSRLPWKFIYSIGLYYIKKAIHLKGSVKEQSDNYYFLTLIHTGATHKKSDKDLLQFKTKTGFEFCARRSGSDLEVFNQVWGRKEYQLATDQLKKSTSNHAQVNIIDAGANIGYSTLFFLHEFPKAQIVSIEPDQENCKLIRKNLFLNKADVLVDVKEMGLWDKACNLKTINTFRDGRSWSIQVVESEEDTALKAISLPDIIKERKWNTIDLLKIDVEGAEACIFNDKENILQILSITKVLALEIHDEIADRNKIYDTLRQCGFLYFDHNDLTIAYKENNNN